MEMNNYEDKNVIKNIHNKFKWLIIELCYLLS